jgi:hypothetical protein
MTEKVSSGEDSFTEKLFIAAHFIESGRAIRGIRIDL